MINSLKPKDAFQSESLRSDAWGEVALSPAFKSACAAAWAEFSLRRLTHDQFAGYKLSGAKDFLEVLLNLSEKAPLQEATPKDQLIPT